MRRIRDFLLDIDKRWKQPAASPTDTRPPPDNFDRPHDRLFRYAFERPEIAEGELRTLLPPEVMAALDFTTLKLEPGSLADPEFAQLKTDLLYRVELAGEESFVFLLFEHQSSPDALKLADWLDLLRDLVATLQGREDFRLWMRYIHRTADFSLQQLLELIRQVGSNAEEIAMTSAERLKAEGRAEGKLGGQAELLLKQLSFRFGELSNDVQTRVATASLEQLAVYAERVLSAPSLDDVLR